MTLPFIPPARPIIGEAEMDAVRQVMLTGMLAQGAEVAQFEQEFAETLVDGRECVAVSSGTAGLHLGLLAAGLEPGDEVIVPSFTFAATANSVVLAGGVPVFADIDPVTFCLDPASVAAAITDRTRAIMPVHLYGHPADMTALRALADAHGLRLFEDAAQAHGATLDGRAVGSFGDFGMFSLYPTKNMTAGEGGMVSAATPEIARRLRLLRNQGMEKQYENEIVGFNARMTNLHAAIGRVQLARLAGWTAQRRRNAAFLSAHLEGVVVPTVAAGATHVWHQYTIRVAADRDRVVAALREEHGVGSGVYYPIPNHELPSLRRFAPPVALDRTAEAAAQVISLPVHPSLSDEDLDRIVTGVNAVVKAGA
jgi:dTDP-4-amino-4,6-dideoxygalactose transaminase